jgi:hypothetical protein
LPVGASRSTTTGTIGDGPHGSAGDRSGDFDFYRLGTLHAGENLTIDIDTPLFTFDSVVGLWDAAGTLIATRSTSRGATWSARR